MEEEYYTYFLQYGDEEPKEVTKKEFIKAERSAGFHPKCYDPDYKVCATAGFSSSMGNVRGTVKRKKDKDSE